MVWVMLVVNNPTNLHILVKAHLGVECIDLNLV